MQLLSRLACALAAVAAAVPLSACASASGAATAPEASSIVLDVVPTADTAGIYIAQDEGFFARQGLSVSIVPVGGAEYGLGDLQDGRAQLTEGNYVSFILAQAAGRFAAPGGPRGTPGPSRPVSLRIIASTSQLQPGNQALYVMPGAAGETVRDLVAEHATVGVNVLHNIGTLLLGSLLAGSGYRVNALRQVPESLPSLPRLLAEHKVTAAWLPEPLGTMAEEQYGAVPLADFDQGSLQNFPIGTVAGMTSWVRSHPGTVAAFLRALEQGQQVADTDRAAAERALVRNQVAPTAEVAATMSLPSYPLFMDVPLMQRVPDAMHEFGIIGRPFTMTSMIQPERGETGG